MHYLHGSTEHSSNEKDMKLPFKTVTDNSFSVFYYNPPVTYTFKKILYISQQKLPVFYRGDAYTFSYLSAIWQPPKTC